MSVQRQLDAFWAARRSSASAQIDAEVGGSAPPQLLLPECRLRIFHLADVYELANLAALKTCVDDPTCTGVTTTWYVGAPFQALRAVEAFRADEGSYACTTLVGGRP